MQLKVKKGGNGKNGNGKRGTGRATGMSCERLRGRGLAVSRLDSRRLFPALVGKSRWKSLGDLLNVDFCVNIFARFRGFLWSYFCLYFFFFLMERFLCVSMDFHGDISR